ncbi:hypothetical protein JOF29_008183 [Kribbella aluminosa]|uniref:DUF3040 domain-containing protein n=1 Tax=Kribbella aluminosa TaxID=416017 RepID=A0ABS4UZK0_9ACTN|nr:DUF3040 domain-containing protein [Kribbella aluminosa]MBP2357073.1 hypothetical protein [Kribbella aluminosa]
MAAAPRAGSCATVTRWTGGQGFVWRGRGLDWRRPIEIALIMEGSTVPLSEEEQRQFEQLERALAAEDPKFVSAMRGTNVRLYYRRRAVLAGVGFVLGIVVLMTGAILPNTVIGVIGFVMMVACLYVAALSMKRISNAGESDDIPPPPPAKRHRTKHESSGTFMERMEDRWRRRREEDL